jgi:hypothetical protein
MGGVAMGGGEDFRLPRIVFGLLLVLEVFCGILKIFFFAVLFFEFPPLFSFA